MYTFIMFLVGVILMSLWVLDFARAVDGPFQQGGSREFPSSPGRFLVRIWFSPDSPQGLLGDLWSVEVVERQSRERVLKLAYTKRDAKRLAKTIVEESCSRHGFTGKDVSYDIESSFTH